MARSDDKLRTVRLQIIDEITGEPLEYVNVRTNAKSISLSDGTFLEDVLKSIKTNLGNVQVSDAKLRAALQEHLDSNVHVDPGKLENAITGFSYDKETGVVRFTRYDGEDILWDTTMEHIPIDITLDKKTNMLKLVTDKNPEGVEIDFSKFIDVFEGEATDSTTTRVTSENHILVNINKKGVEKEHLALDIQQFLKYLEGFLDKYEEKIEKIEDEANKYILPPSSTTVLGGIKTGFGLEADEAGLTKATNVLMGNTPADAIPCGIFLQICDIGGPSTEPVPDMADNTSYITSEGNIIEYNKETGLYNYINASTDGSVEQNLTKEQVEDKLVNGLDLVELDATTSYVSTTDPTYEYVVLPSGDGFIFTTTEDGVKTFVGYVDTQTFIDKFNKGELVEGDIGDITPPEPIEPEVVIEDNTSYITSKGNIIECMSTSTRSRKIRLMTASEEENTCRYNWYGVSGNSSSITTVRNNTKEKIVSYLTKGETIIDMDLFTWHKYTIGTVVTLCAVMEDGQGFNYRVSATSGPSSITGLVGNVTPDMYENAVNNGSLEECDIAIGGGMAIIFLPDVRNGISYITSEGGIVIYMGDPEDTPYVYISPEGETELDLTKEEIEERVKVLGLLLYKESGCTWYIGKGGTLTTHACAVFSDGNNYKYSLRENLELGAYLGGIDTATVEAAINAGTYRPATRNGYYIEQVALGDPSATYITSDGDIVHYYRAVNWYEYAFENIYASAGKTVLERLAKDMKLFELTDSLQWYGVWNSTYETYDAYVAPVSEGYPQYRFLYTLKKLDTDYRILAVSSSYMQDHETIINNGSTAFATYKGNCEVHITPLGGDKPYEVVVIDNVKERTNYIASDGTVVVYNMDTNDYALRGTRYETCADWWNISKTLGIAGVDTTALKFFELDVQKWYFVYNEEETTKYKLYMKPIDADFAFSYTLGTPYDGTYSVGGTPSIITVEEYETEVNKDTTRPGRYMISSATFAPKEGEQVTIDTMNVKTSYITVDGTVIEYITEEQRYQYHCATTSSGTTNKYLNNIKGEFSPTLALYELREVCWYAVFNQNAMRAYYAYIKLSNELAFRYELSSAEPNGVRPLNNVRPVTIAEFENAISTGKAVHIARFGVGGLIENNWDYPYEEVDTRPGIAVSDMAANTSYISSTGDTIEYHEDTGKYSLCCGNYTGEVLTNQTMVNVQNTLATVNADIDAVRLFTLNDRTWYGVWNSNVGQYKGYVQVHDDIAICYDLTQENTGYALNAANPITIDVFNQDIASPTTRPASYKGNHELSITPPGGNIDIDPGETEEVVVELVDGENYITSKGNLIIACGEQEEYAPSGSVTTVSIYDWYDMSSGDVSTAINPSSNNSIKDIESFLTTGETVTKFDEFSWYKYTGGTGTTIYAIAPDGSGFNYGVTSFNNYAQLTKLVQSITTDEYNNALNEELLEICSVGAGADVCVYYLPTFVSGKSYITGDGSLIIFPSMVGPYQYRNATDGELSYMTKDEIKTDVLKPGMKLYDDTADITWYLHGARADDGVVTYTMYAMPKNNDKGFHFNVLNGAVTTLIERTTRATFNKIPTNSDTSRIHEYSSNTASILTFGYAELMLW